MFKITRFTPCWTLASPIIQTIYESHLCWWRLRWLILIHIIIINFHRGEEFHPLDSDVSSGLQYNLWCHLSDWKTRQSSLFVALEPGVVCVTLSRVWKVSLYASRTGHTRESRVSAPGLKATVDILAKNVTLTSPFYNRLHCCVFRTLGWLYGDVLCFCSVLFMAIVSQWVEFSPSVKLQHGYACWEMSLKPPSALVVNGWNFKFSLTIPIYGFTKNHPTRSLTQIAEDPDVPRWIQYSTSRAPLQSHPNWTARTSSSEWTSSGNWVTPLRMWRQPWGSWAYAPTPTLCWESWSRAGSALRPAALKGMRKARAPRTLCCPQVGSRDRPEWRHNSGIERTRTWSWGRLLLTAATLPSGSLVALPLSFMAWEIVNSCHNFFLAAMLLRQIRTFMFQ